MDTVKSAAFLALFFGCFLHLGLTIKCWDCRSDNDPKCGNPFDNSSLVITDCAQEPELPHLPGVRPTMCRKIRQKMHGEWRYFRSCAYMGEPGIEGDERFCLMRTGSYNIFMEYCTCNSKDGCNGSGLLRTNKTAYLLSTLLTGVVTWILAI
ncbi:UPAR/Ly6 domain-containing protein crok [Eurosta solidaginis]|uniref:UPAR/Ly6 domain-containing protein crok n=1 Tax=Eurosta solidaginis TaxID=178769 RepID=UPI0035317494